MTLGGLLGEMAAGSFRRLEESRRRVPEGELRRRAAAMAPPPPLRLDETLPGTSFDLIAEIKRHSPSAGPLAGAGRGPASVAERALLYARAGAVAVSVLTEPERFGGSLEDLTAAAAAAGVPVMRKDFLIDPYQVWEARAAGAGGVLLIVGMLDDVQLLEMLEAAREAGLFALVESFDGEEMRRFAALMERRECSTGDPPVLAGINCRNLRTLAVEFSRFVGLAPKNRPNSRWPVVAESGIEGAAAAGRVAELGYRLALVGTALMRAPEPGVLIERMLAAGRRHAPAAGKDSP